LGKVGYGLEVKSMQAISLPVDGTQQPKIGINDTLARLIDAAHNAGPIVYVIQGDGCVMNVSVIIL
jgi:hypothetical protein